MFMVSVHFADMEDKASGSIAQHSKLFYNKAPLLIYSNILPFYFCIFCVFSFSSVSRNQHILFAPSFY